MITHFMIDLETISNDTRNGMLLSLGAVAFRLDEAITLPTEDDMEFVINIADRYRKFYTTISLTSQEKIGLQIDVDTLHWWLHKDRIALFMNMLSPTALSIQYVFEKFMGWVVTQEPSASQRRLWSHGSTYDCLHLMEKWERVMGKDADFNCVCPFRQIRDTRTLFELYEMKYKKSPYPDIPTEQEMKHHALFDAYVQAVAVQTAIHEFMK